MSVHSDHDGASLSMQLQSNDHEDSEFFIFKPNNDTNSNINSHSQALLESPQVIIGEGSQLREKHSKYSYYFVWTQFFILGTVNNFGYVVVLSAAKSMADCFDESALIGVESWALIGIGFILKSVNAFYLEWISHRVRGYCTAIAFFIGYTLLTISVYIDFWFAIFAILLIGGACSFGESVILGYCKLFPAKMSSTAWSSGTGLAGLAGSGMYLLLSEVFKFSNESIFMCMIPTSFVFILSVELSWKSDLRKTSDDLKYAQKQNEMRINVRKMDNENDTKWDSIVRCFNKTWYRCLMLMLVYIFEYVCSVGFAQIANTNRGSGEQDLDYVLLAVCYQFGVFLSRSSVSVIELPYFGTMTTIQFINCIIWGLQCQYNILHYIYIEYALMVFVGLLGGAMYVNVAYNILSDPTINEKDRELCINFMAIAVNLGITLSAVAELVIDNTFFANLVDKSHSSNDKHGCSTFF